MWQKAFVQAAILLILWWRSWCVVIVGFCLCACSPELFNYEDLLNNDSHTNLKHAFRVAHEKLGIEQLLDPEGKIIVSLAQSLP